MSFVCGSSQATAQEHDHHRYKHQRYQFCFDDVDHPHPLKISAGHSHGPGLTLTFRLRGPRELKEENLPLLSRLVTLAAHPRSVLDQIYRCCSGFDANSTSAS